MYTPFIYGILQTGYCEQVADIGEVGGYAIAILIMVTTLVLPVCIMLYVYLVIIYTLRADVTKKFPQTCKIYLETKENCLDGNSQKDQGQIQTGRYRERGRRNVLITPLLVSLTFLICWTPDMIVYFHHNVVTRHDWNDAFHQIVILLAASNVGVNPLIYTLKYENFQKGLRQIFKKTSTPNTSISASFNI
ncbi:G-protein coupled receptor 39 [Holothuria leucospilota]|uniref:G-protein coupled receptor 39 n=1 Tax=Holothuria leucospilota TaxID=206669 RepID=A0A9Q1CH50_HOLLE|nr:G-protein coupled receptor 39 [Holothuria leucospilota]